MKILIHLTIFVIKIFKNLEMKNVYVYTHILFNI